MAVVFPFFQTLTDWIRPKPKLETPASPPSTVVASRDLRDRWGTYPTAGLTPALLIQIIRNSDCGSMTEIAEMYEEMEEKDAHLCSVLQTRKLSVLGLDRSVMPYSTEPDKEGKKTQELAEFVEHALDRITNLDNSLFNLMDAIGKGYSVCEINWVKEGNKVIVDSLEWIHPKKITFVDSFEPMLVSDKQPLKGEPFPAWKTLYWSYKARSGWDTRAGLLRVVALLFLMKNYALKDWAVFNEVFGMPLRLGKYDPAATASDKDALYAAVRALGSDAAGIISKNTEIEFIQAVKGTGSDNPFLSMQQYCNNEISKAVLGPTLTTDTAGATGTYSAGKVHATVRQDLLEADGASVGDVLNKQLIFPLIGFNFGWDVAKQICPFIRFAVKSEVDLQALSSTYKNLLDAGVPISLNHINEKFDLPEIEEDEKFVGGDKLHDPNASQPVPVPEQPPAGPEGEPVPKPGEGEKPVEGGPEGGGEKVEESSGKKLDKKLIEAYIAKHPAEWEKPIIMTQAKLDKIASDAVSMSADMGKMILRPVKKLIKNGASLDEIKLGLEKVYGESDPKELSNLLYMAMMLSYF